MKYIVTAHRNHNSLVKIQILSQQKLNFLLKHINIVVYITHMISSIQLSTQIQTAYQITSH